MESPSKSWHAYSYRCSEGKMLSFRPKNLTANFIPKSLVTSQKLSFLALLVWMVGGPTNGLYANDCRNRTMAELNFGLRWYWQSLSTYRKVLLYVVSVIHVVFFFINVVFNLKIFAHPRGWSWVLIHSHISYKCK